MTIKPSEILEYDSKSYTEPSSRESRIEVEFLDSVEMANDEVIKLDSIAESQSGDGVKWLKKLKHELRAQRKSLTPENILYCTAFVRRMLEDTSTATEANFIRFEEAFISRLPNTTTVGEDDVHVKSAKLQQEFDESLSEYSSRVTALLHKFGFKNLVTGVELSAAEAGTLNSIKSKYIWPLKCGAPKKKLQEEIEIQQRLKTLKLFDKQARTADYNNLLSYAHSLDRHPFNNSMQMRPSTTNPSINPVEQQANIGQDISQTQQGNRWELHERSESQNSIINDSETLHPSDFLCSTC
ncbi:hypothetical protein GcM3_198039 [Golovinomyces cichoracearum]|uniref:Uncharacterized protein n=1 Tax=Golovinomyces cichoracearum TaxID=62708 RepID=A0A420HFA3_9PEZI|nr:hypothetical protein GcM3_198039 [Golovinomyces cichoracearum]